MSEASKIEKLCENNYSTWKMVIEAVCIANGTWAHVAGQVIRPTVVEGNAASQVAAESWDSKDAKARSDLLLSLSSSQVKHLRGLTTAYSMWRKLKEIHEETVDTQIVTLLSTLMTKRLTSDKDIDKHLEFYSDTIRIFEEMAEPPSLEKITITALLLSLPDDFAPIRSAIRTLRVLPTLTDVKRQIKEDLRGRQAAEISNVSTNCVRVKQTKTNYKKPQQEKTQNKSGKGKESNEKRKIKCEHCGRSGHVIDNCFFRRRLAQSKQKTDECTLTIPEHCSLLTDFNKNTTDRWILDSGATSHICNRRNLFTTINQRQNEQLKMANSGTSTIDGVGAVDFEKLDGSIVTLSRVLHVPDLRTNLLAVSKITDHGHTVIFKKDSAKVINNKGDVLIAANREADLYVVNTKRENANATEDAKCSTLTTWHERLGHVNERDLKIALRRTLQKGDWNENEKLSFCKACILGKQTRIPFPKSSNSRSTKLLELIHTDLCGPMRKTSIGGARYFITFKDDKSKWCEIYFLRQTSEALNAFRNFQAMAEKLTAEKIKILRSDNGREYINKVFDHFLRENGIKRNLTADYTPQQNGVAERYNRTLVEMARCMLLHSSMSQNFWAEAINTANYIRNRCPS